MGMIYEVFYRCGLCSALFTYGSVVITRLYGTLEKDLVEMVKSHHGGIDFRGIATHDCDRNTNMLRPESAPIPQMGVGVFAGLRLKK